MNSWRDIIAWLRSPICGEPLVLDGDRLLCGACGLMFPVIDGVPALLAGEARERTGEPADIDARCSARQGAARGGGHG